MQMQQTIYCSLRAAGRTIQSGKQVERTFRKPFGLFRIPDIKHGYA